MRLDTRTKPDLTFFPGSTEAEIAQNLYCIITTPKGSVPMDRAYGVDYSFIHAPLPAARAMFAASVVEAVATYEPRATIENVDFEFDSNNPDKLIPVLEVSMVEQVWV